MNAGRDPTEWLRGLLRAAGEAPGEPQRFARQLAGVEAALRRRRARHTAAIVTGSALAAAASLALLFWGRLDARTDVNAEHYYEAPAATELETPGQAHRVEFAPARSVPRYPSETRALTSPSEPDPIAEFEGPPDPASAVDAHEQRAAEPAHLLVGADTSATRRRASTTNRARPAPAPTLTAGALLKRANEARAHRRVDDARAALLELRRQFPESPAAEHASFLLGRVESELAGDQAAAIAWFSRYVQDYPDGRFAPGARGRLLRSLSERETDSAAAEDAAREYLAHHPKGPYAELARRTLSSAE